MHDVGFSKMSRSYTSLATKVSVTIFRLVPSAHEVDDAAMAARTDAMLRKMHELRKAPMQSAYLQAAGTFSGLPGDHP